MTSTTRTRRLLVGIVAACCLAFAGTTSAQAQSQVEDRAPNTVLTVNVRSCEGCEITLVSYLDGDMGAGWASDPHTVQNGKAAFVVPTAKTEGLSVMVRTPWEGQTGYVTMVVFRYKGLAAGERIGFNRARTMKKASGCWAGTTEEAGQPAVQGRRRRGRRPGCATGRGAREASPGPPADPGLACRRLLPVSSSSARSPPAGGRGRLEVRDMLCRRTNVVSSSARTCTTGSPSGSPRR